MTDDEHKSRAPEPQANLTGASPARRGCRLGGMCGDHPEACPLLPEPVTAVLAPDDDEPF